MNINELKELVFGGESERVEFKRSTGQRTEAAKAVCGMLNGLGGFVMFGVTDSGGIVGQQVYADNRQYWGHSQSNGGPLQHWQSVRFQNRK